MRIKEKLKPLWQFWYKLTSGSVSRQIFGAAITVGLFTTLVKLMAMAKELVVAWRFGIGDSVDAFLIALEIPALIINVIANSFAPALIPTYIKVQEQKGNEAAHKLLSGTLFCGLSLLSVATILMIVAAPIYLPLIASGFDHEKLQLTFNLLYAIAPIVFLSGIVAIWGAVLNAQEKFALVSFAPILTPIITIILLIMAESWEMFSLVLGLVVGLILQLIILGTALHRQNIPLFPKWYGFDEHLRQTAIQYIPIVAGALLICSTSPVDKTMAAMLPSGSVAALNYGHRLIASGIGLISTALSAAIIPYFSKMVAQGDWRLVNRTLRQYLGLIMMVTIPTTAIFILFSEPLIKFVFQRGLFTAKNSYLVSQIQNLFALKIPFYLGDFLLLKVIASMGENYILSWVAGFNLLVNIGLNYLFMQWLGVRGIALSTSCVYLLSFLILLIFIDRRLSQLRNCQKHILE